MSDDLIPDISINAETTTQLKKNLRSLNILLVLAALYSIFEVYYWTPYISVPSSQAPRIKHFFYYYRFLPVEAYLRLVFAVAAYSLYYRGYKAQLKGIVNNDPASFTFGFKLFNTSLRLSILFYVIVFADMLCKTFLTA